MPRIDLLAFNYPVAELLTLACTADELGFDGLWLGEHYLVPQYLASTHPGLAGSGHQESSIIAPDTQILDPWCLLGAIAASTRRIRLGTGISVAPLNHPLLLARAAVTAHAVSGGRFRFGAGAGWLREEFAAIGIPFAERASRLEETLGILRQAWAGGYHAHQGRHFAFAPVQITPRPVAIPLFCGGNAEPALARAARLGDGWINSGMITLDEAVRLRTRLHELRARSPAGDAEFTLCVRPRDVSSHGIGAFVAAGFEHVVITARALWPPSTALPYAEKRARLATIARDFDLTATTDNHTQGAT